ncbi:MAG: ABC transporter ATP-binding protein [Pseudomonadota bacterium]
MFHLQKVSHRYDAATALSVDDLQIGEAGLTAIVGRNGSGKTTLLRVLAREIRPKGDVLLQGEPLTAQSARTFARHVAHLPQNPPAAPGLTVRELVALGRYPWRGLLGAHGAEDHRIIGESLDRTGLTTDADRLIETLSGGERQRAWIAMLLAQQSPILLLDEPTSALDLAYQTTTLDLLRNLAAEDVRVIIVLHDINMAARYADQIIALCEGCPVYQGAAAAFMDSAHLRDVFNVEMLIAQHPVTTTPYAIHA